MDRVAHYLRRWETLLLLILLVVIAVNAAAVPGFLGLQNQSNLLVLSLEKAIVALAMAFVIISGEIDLSVASVMGLCAVVMAVTWQSAPIETNSCRVSNSFCKMRCRSGWVIMGVMPLSFRAKISSLMACGML